MLPSVLFYAIGDVIHGDNLPGLVKKASNLTMLANFTFPYVSCNLGVYWYFGLTFHGRFVEVS